MAVNVQRPRAIVFDILGTASKSGFLERVLFPFLKVNLDSYVTQHWTKSDFIKMYQRIQEQAVEFQKLEPNTPGVLPHDSSEAKASLMNFIAFVSDNGINAPSVMQLRFKVWFEGYQQSKIRTPIYSDVPRNLRKWFAEGIKFYVFSNTWVAAQKALLHNTNHGDLTNLISGHYDNDFGQLVEPDSWRRLCQDIRESPNDVLFLTKSLPEAKVASETGIQVVLVLTHRHNVKAVPKEDREHFPYVRSLDELAWLEGSMMPAQPAGASVGGAGAASQATAVSNAPLNTTMSGQQVISQQPLVSGATSIGASTGAVSGSSSANAMTGRSVHSRSTSGRPSTSGRQSTSGGASASSKPSASSGRTAGSSAATQLPSGAVSGNSSSSRTHSRSQPPASSQHTSSSKRE